MSNYVQEIEKKGQFLGDEICDFEVFWIYYPPEVRRGKYWGWEYSCCNTSLLSRYGNHCIIMQRNVVGY